MFLTPDSFADPYPLARYLRETDPVHWSSEAQAWILTRYDDVAAGLHDPRFSAGRLPAQARLSQLGVEHLGPLFDTMRRMLTFVDAPVHTHLRRLANKGFTRSAVEGWRIVTQETVDRLLDRVAVDGKMDVVADLARPLPLAVIAEVIGIPQAEHGRLGRWSQAMGRFFGNLEHSAQQLGDVQRDILEFTDYLHGLIGLRRGNAGAGSDVVSALVRDAGDDFPDDELVATLILLVGAGTVTTTDLLGNAVLALLCHPTHAARLRRLDASPAFLSTAVEELLRYDSPVQMTGRLLTTDVEIGNRRMGRGQSVLFWLGAANRDPARFSEPDTLDFDRADVKHLSFGGGGHFCLGAPLARMQAHITLTTLVQRFPAMRLDDRRLDWERYPTLRGLSSLHVHLR